MISVIVSLYLGIAIGMFIVTSLVKSTFEGKRLSFYDICETCVRCLFWLPALLIALFVK